MIISTDTQAIIITRNDGQTFALKGETVTMADDRINEDQTASAYWVDVAGDTIQFDDAEAAFDYYLGFVA